MVVYNEDKTTILESYDLTKGYLVDDFIEQYHAEQEEIQELYHYETIAEYANGGKDAIKVVDREGRPYKEAYTEQVPILVYKPYTQKELYQQELDSLVEWFNTEYTKQDQKLRRLNTLRILTDSGHNPYDQLMYLYEEAERRRRRIQYLEALIND